VRAALRRLTRVAGLRTRLLLALVATSAVTLGVAALALLSPLQDRLAAADADAVKQAALATRPSLQAALREDDGIIGPRATEIVLDLERRTNARVLLVPAVPNVQPERALDTGLGVTRYDDIYDVWTNGRTLESESAEGVRIAVPLNRRGDSVPFVLALRKPITGTGDLFDTVRSAFVTAALAGLAVALVLGLALSATLVRRLARLRTVALRTADDGPETPVPEDRLQDEVGDLARALRRMQDSLRRQEDARRQFVATASHELRTPLTSLSGNLELLAEDLETGRVDLDDARGQIRGAQGQLRRLQLLATELLELSRLDAGVELHPEPVELAELGRAVAAEFELRARSSGVVLDLVAPRAPVWARADPGATARVARILIDNALRFAPRGSTIRILPAYQGPVAVLEVADRGPGVPEDEREAIFERFRRGTSTGGEGGFGLGLAIGRELAERMGGRLELRVARTPGGRFVLMLPVEAPPG
jgi:signal transduction histidine kinase